MRRAADGTVTEVLAAPWNARSAVHEYGGGEWWVDRGVLWFVDWATQRLHRVAPGGSPDALTPEPAHRGPCAMPTATSRRTGRRCCASRRSTGAMARW